MRTFAKIYQNQLFQNSRSEPKAYGNPWNVYSSKMAEAW